MPAGRPNVKPGCLFDVETAEKFDFQYRPGEYTTAKEAIYAVVDVPGHSEQVLHYSHSTSKVWEMSILLDSLSEGDDIHQRVAWLEAATMSDFDTFDRSYEPPLLLMSLGPQASAYVRLRSVRANYTLFTAEGRALRATVRLSFTEVFGYSKGRARYLRDRATGRSQAYVRT